MSLKNIFLASFFFAFVYLFSACQFSPYPQDVYDQNNSSDVSEHVQDVGGNPSPGSQEIYATADLNNLCVDHKLCEPDYEKISEREPLNPDQCNFDYDPNLKSSFILNRGDAPVNGLNLLLSKEDLFFLAWVSIRLQINPYFLMGIMAAESSGNCAAVSHSNGEGCFQITNTFGQAQLMESYPERVKDWTWSERTGEYYPDEIFMEEEAYFGEVPASDQFRITLDPTEAQIEDILVSSVVNFPFGIIGAGLYFRWQEYLLFHHYESLRDAAKELFQSENGKALWQAAAYNGGAYGAAKALMKKGNHFLDEMREETQNYAPTVVDYCQSFEAGTLIYTASYSFEDSEWMIDLLSFTYPEKTEINWNEVKEDVRQVFYDDGTQSLHFVDDIKALIYVISTHLPELSPEWPEEDSI